MTKLQRSILGIVVKNSQLLTITFDSFMISMLICILIPLNLITQNIDDFAKFSYMEYFLYGSLFTFISSVIIFSIFWIIQYISPKLSTKILTLLLGYLIICGLYLSIHSGVIDGTGALKISYLNVALAIIISIIGSLFFEKKFRLFLWLALAGATITTAFGLTSLDKYIETDTANKKFFEVSSNHKNIFLISFDSLQSNNVAFVLDNNQDLRKEFEGFVAFNHTMSVAPFTLLSIITTKLGYLPDEDINTETLINSYSKDFITRTLYHENYQVSVYSSFMLGEPKTIISIPQFRIAPINTNTYLLALKTSFQKYLPIQNILNTHISILDFFDTPSLTSIPDTQLYTMTKQDPHILSYYKTDMIHFDHFVQHLSASSTKPTAHFHHYLFTHDPMTFDANCNYRISNTIEQSKSSALQETECSIKKFIAFLRKLKEIDAFHNSLIIFASDHGYECEYNIPDSPPTRKISQRWCLSRYMPFLMIKPFASKTPSFRYNNGQASLLDIPKIICEESISEDHLCKKYEGINLLDNGSTNISRQRSILVSKDDIDLHNREYNGFEIVDIGR